MMRLAVSLDEYRRQQTHETREHDQLDAARRRISIDDRLIVGLAAGKRFMIQDFGANAVILARTKP